MEIYIMNNNNYIKNLIKYASKSGDDKIINLTVKAILKNELKNGK